MSDYVLGKNVTVSILHDFGSGEAYYPLFCAKSMELDVVIDEIETVGDSGSDREFLSGLQSAVLTLVGVTKTKDPAEVDKAGPFFLYSIRKNKKTYKITFQDQDGNIVPFTLTAIMRRLNFSSDVMSFNQSIAELRISGPLVTDGYASGGGGTCVPVSSGAFNPPDGTLNEAYSYTLPLSGTNPKTLGTPLTKPSWMGVSVLTGDLVLSGTPTTYPSHVGTFFLEIHIQNACGAIGFSEVEINIAEDGRNVFVINNSSANISITNANGHVYSFGPSNANDGNIKMQTDSISVSLTGTKNYEFLQDLVGGGTLVNGGTTSTGTITTSDLSITNYLRFSD